MVRTYLYKIVLYDEISGVESIKFDTIEIHENFLLSIHKEIFKRYNIGEHDTVCIDLKITKL